MEFQKLFKVHASSTKSVMKSVLTDYPKLEGLTLFNNIMPTAVLFNPQKHFKGSLHFLLMPPDSLQEFHFHPTPRYLIILGDTNIQMYYNECSTSSDPNFNAKIIDVPKNYLCAVRFKGNFWHKFYCEKSNGLGCLTFTFHEDDEEEASKTISLMENKTTFWK